MIVILYTESLSAIQLTGECYQAARRRSTIKIVEFAAEREPREARDADCVRRDWVGRELFLFALDYQMVDCSARQYG